MSVSNLTLALSVFNDLDVRAIDVGKVNSKFYHVYYRHEGKNRVMLVPRSGGTAVQLQAEVASLLSRNNETQERIGNADAINL